ncbi:hypothetical protein MUK70_12000 [Dyadobacter chenwenxiniae]|uniref:Uncharacterized protein n=1 Tax=Dyadobacter chenwenxiniae TaxID=2906456 RepID=A0A9X1TD59_9BACT|nr:hypothetical protein [Dyadobacter chenwenxiniae]MCF0059965.1 hypothetical protein [Dyadobacter chenwenxiniae]UON85704.1 hypothetical protein MUK70_12000 [Dyadobacter chenwenxiniae]
MALKIDFLDSIFAKLTAAFNVSNVLKEGGTIFVKSKREVQTFEATVISSGDMPINGVVKYGASVDVSQADRILIELCTKSFTKGSLAGLQCYIQALSAMDNVTYYLVPVDAVFTANPATIDPAAVTTQIFKAFYLPGCFQFIRVGFIATTAHSGGQIIAQIIVKK